MAVDWLKQVIDNMELKDDAVVTLAGGQTVPLGDIRSLTKAQQKLLTDREATVAAREAELRKNLETLQAAQAETAKLFTDLQNQRTNQPDPTKVITVDPLDQLERDPILGPIVKSLKQQQSSYEDLKVKALAPIVKAQQDMASAYVQDRIEDLYDRVVPEAKKATITLDHILKVANDNNLKTRTGIPDIRRAYQHISTKPMTQEDIDAQLKAAREEGRKEAIEAARLRVPRPGIGATGGRPESSFKPVINDNTTVGGALDEALRAAAKDADIWANIDTSIVQ
jgi:hypothetical protein